jgi:hypothetical protein
VAIVALKSKVYVMAVKKNKDGLMGGSMVSESDFIRVQQTKRKAAKAKALAIATEAPQA